MTGLGEPQWAAALTLLVTALFVGSGFPLPLRWRKVLRFSAIAGFIIGMVAVSLEVVLWLSHGGK